MATFTKGQVPWNKGIRGIHHASEETKQRQRLAHLGKPKLKSRRRIIKRCPACGKDFETGGRAGDQAQIWCSRACMGTGRFRHGSTPRQMSDVEAAYLAGVIDGEGTIMLYKANTVRLRLVVANTKMALLEWCKEHTAVGSIVVKAHANPRHSDSGTWQANAHAAEGVVAQIRPYLVIKAEQADLALDFQHRRLQPELRADKEWQEAYRLTMRKLNARGGSTNISSERIGD